MRCNISLQLEHNTYGRTKQSCPECGGEGQIPSEKDRCKKCKGKRTVTEKKRQEVVVEPGMADGAKLVLRGEGDKKVVLLFNCRQLTFNLDLYS